ncbi:MAG: ABC transporter substrate-binding protein [Succinivibrio sp.]
MRSFAKSASAVIVASAIAAGSLSVSTSAVAADGFDEANVKGSITFYTNRTDLIESGAYARYEKEFKAIYPNVTEVKVVGFADYQGGIRPRMNTGDYGDVVLILPSVPSDQYANFYEPLTAMYGKDDIYFYDTWASTQDNNIYGISIGNAVEGLVYNKNVLKEAGVETPIKTLTDFYAACDKIKAINKTPIFVNFGAQWPLQQFDKLPLVIEGNDQVYEKMLTQDKPFSDPDSAYYKSLKFLKTLIDKKYTENDIMTNAWEDSKNAIAKGTAAMYYLGNWVIPQVIERGAKSEDIGFMPIPADDSGVLKAQMNHDWAYAVSKFSKNKDTAKAYVKFLLETSDFDTVAGFIPTVKNRVPGLAQLHEYLEYNPEIIQTPVNSSKFIEVTNKSKIDFYSGGYIQDVITADNFDKALEKLDARWKRAKERVK